MTITVIKNADPPNIKKVKMSCDTCLGDDIKNPLPKGSFSMLLCAKPGSGKTSMVVNLLTDKTMYRDKFEHIYLIIPAGSFQSLPEKSPIRKHDKVYHELNGSMLEEILDKIKEAREEGENSLILIDDFMSSLKNREVQHILEYIYANRRHLRTSSIICTQVYNSLPLILRKVLSHCMLWQVTNKKELASIRDELFTGMDDGDVDKILKIVYKSNHDFMFIDAVDRKYYNHDWDEIIVKHDEDV